ncbi:MAG: hypothetical protein KGJ89_04260 [Patescibacteria group bacterium]|nr:hypothetical protein [Patescibacteria group bacterium]MDE2015336.1 hypothetical protein [Patescibacteria group bacterium]MDE2227141.1 hypothetical protein [Patescibacteria group bacterium]
MQNNFRRELFINFGVIVAVILIFGAVFYWFTGELSSQANQIAADRTLISKRTSAIAVLADLKDNSAQANTYKQAIDKVLVSQDQLLTFPNWLDSLARARQVTLSFSFQGNQTAPQGDSPGYIQFSINASGDLSNIISFIKDVEFQSPQFLVSLDGFSLSGAGSNYSVSLGGRVFFK